MEQMTVEISFDFSWFRLPQYVGEFKLFFSGKGIPSCAMLGPDRKNGIFNFGDIPADALVNCNGRLRELKSEKVIFLSSIIYCC